MNSSISLEINVIYKKKFFGTPLYCPEKKMVFRTKKVLYKMSQRGFTDKKHDTVSQTEKH